MSLHQTSLFVLLLALSLAPRSALAQPQPAAQPHGLRGSLPTMATVQVDPARSAEPSRSAPSAPDGVQRLPAQYGTRTDVRIDLKQAGTRYALPSGGTVWYVRVAAPAARSLRLAYDRFRLPPGARFFVYDPAGRVVHGAFTNQHNAAHGGFATNRTPGPAVVLEYYEPPTASFPGRLRVSTVVQAERHSAWSTPRAKSATYQPSALGCSINTACPEGDPWAPQTRATVLIDRGGSTCSGVLLNNTAEDFTPYVLTAHHCGTPAVGDTLNWTVHFNYASPTCENPTTPPPKHSMVGVIVRAAHAGWREDFALLELVNPIPPAHRPYYAGWSLDDATTSRSMAPSYPGGAIRKMALDRDPVTDLGKRWLATFDEGTVEGGSSGAPLFDANHRVIGHLRGAWSIDLAACSGPGGDDNAATVVFPKLSHIWSVGPSGARVGDFLDPSDTGATHLDGLDSAPPEADAVAWINEIDTRTAETSADDHAEFVEIAGPAGYSLDDHRIDVYTCSSGRAVHRFTEHLQATQPLPNDHDGIGYFVLGGTGLPAGVIDQRFGADARDRLADGSGLIVLRGPSGHELFDYQYDVHDGSTSGACPSSRTTRSPADDYSYTSLDTDSPFTSSTDASLGSTAIGFQRGMSPSTTAAGTEGMIPSPGATNNTAMPVQLSHFHAMVDGQVVQLRWATASETNNAGFEVQHAMDGDFVTRAFVEGRGTTSQPHTYGFTTSNLLAGAHRFRLRQVDADGTASLSPEVDVQVTSEAPFELTRPHPNPFHRSASLTLTVAQSQQVDAVLYDVLGRQVATLHRGVVPANQPTVLRVDGASLSSGLYIVRVTGDGFSLNRKVTLLR